MGVYASLPRNCHGIAVKTMIGMADMAEDTPGYKHRPVFVRNHKIVYPGLDGIDGIDGIDNQLAINRLHNLAHLPAISKFLFVTSMHGALHAKWPASIIGVCDADTARLVAGQRDKKTSYDFFQVEQDSEQITAYQFVMQFVQPGRKIANKLAASLPVVVHCQMGMNRSCTAICMAALLMHQLDDVQMAKLVHYVRRVNKQVRHDVLTNRAFVRLLICFAGYMHNMHNMHNLHNLHKIPTESKLLGLASNFQAHYHKTKMQYYHLFAKLGV